jgi:hypothetical protein
MLLRCFIFSVTELSRVRPPKLLRRARECPSKNFKQHWSVYLENGGTVTRFGRECNNISQMKQNYFTRETATPTRRPAVNFDKAGEKSSYS